MDYKQGESVTSQPSATDPCCKRRRRRRSCPKRRRSGCRKRSVCRKFRGGKKTRNAFLNFLRAYRRKCCGRNVKEIAKKGAKMWNCMSKCEKAPYYRMACAVRKRPRSKCRRRPKCRRKSRACPKKRRRSCRRRKPPCPC